MRSPTRSFAPWFIGFTVSLLAALPAGWAAWRLHEEALARDLERFAIECNRPLNNLRFASSKTLAGCGTAAGDQANQGEDLRAYRFQVPLNEQWQDNRFIHAIGQTQNTSHALRLRHLPVPNPRAFLMKRLPASPAVQDLVKDALKIPGRRAVFLEPPADDPAERLAILATDMPEGKTLLTVVDWQGMASSATQRPDYLVDVSVEPVEFVAPAAVGLDPFEREEHELFLGLPARVRLTPRPAFWRDSRRDSARLAAAAGGGGALFLGRVAGHLARQRRRLEEVVAARTADLRAANLRLEEGLAREQEVNRLKTAFISMVSHELNTPLQLIQSSADLLRRHAGRMPPDQQDGLFARIGAAVNRMSGLTADVLLYSRAEEGRLELDPGPLSLPDFCRALAAELAPPDGEGVTVDAPPDLPTAHLDARLLRHMAGNLLSNGLKYSPPGEPVRVEVRREGDRAVITLTDRGPGVPEADRAHLFHSFHRGANVRHLPGTGLGLMIVRRCAELHGGSVELTFPPAGGTVATLSLPAFGASA